MKSIAPFCLATTLPAASVRDVVEPGFTFGIGRLGGPPGFEPPTVTLIRRAFGLVAIQFKKNAAQPGCFAFAAIPNVSGADMAACRPPFFSGGIKKNPILLAWWVSKFPDSQSPSKMSRPSPAWNLLIIWK